ncbi:acyl-CoA dehydrogenase family protein [Ruminiclostridium cellulolyticum]|uniref:Acyl-CoA dehydrogenase domain protein n=1 Tax=Ruminiclostridium cellulolyticum (strain ATCC 35319 / DSM 5812 / JCM 6584 / H10) TaxID=394503 RepID=B8I2I4_RUMCH|nr:acyl-CoA dehydrogenase family protein [Ruminiclostridium cellulolyticum]ACL75977.1 acyl-CoA dehydrogenase domain protein [Ruminiclostridium cellulolyticum H10]
MEFSFSKELLQLKAMVSKFVDKDLAPFAAEYDKKENPKDCIPWSIIEKAMGLGLGSAAVPKEFGGSGLSSLEILTIIEELARGDAGFAYTLLSTITGAQLITKFGTDEQKNQWLTKIANDQTKRFLMGFALSEPQTGSDNMSPNPNAGMLTTAELTDGQYIINGTKSFITNAGIAGLYLVWARTDKSKGAPQGGLSVFLVPADAPGLKVGKIEDKMGNRLSQQGELIFENCIIPASNLLGKEGMGLPVCLAMIENRFSTVGAIGTGIAQAAFNISYKYAKERVQGGAPIINQQAISHKLANILIAIESSRLLYQKAAWHLDNMIPGMVIGSMSKVAGSEAAIMASNETIQILGCYGYSREYPAEKLLRDSKALSICESANEVQRSNIIMMLQMMEQKPQG